VERVSAWYKSTPLSGDSGLTVGRSRKAAGSGPNEHPTPRRVSAQYPTGGNQVADAEATLPFRLQRKDAR